MKFKKIYIEITNICNLNCSFCSLDNREKKELSLGEFEHILKEINNYTDYIYLHVKGEPLLHSNLNGILSLTKKYNKKVLITTNGYFLKEKFPLLLKYDNIYQINVSLHSENNKHNYLENVIYSCDILSKQTYISYRFWVSKNNEYLNAIRKHYNQNELENNMKLKENIYLSFDEKFIWPNDAKENSDNFCNGGKTHIAILSNGVVSICCLDSNGESNLGNIFDNSFKNIINSDKYNNIISSFQNNKCYLNICKKCMYKNRFK